MPRKPKLSWTFSSSKPVSKLKSNDSIFINDKPYKIKQTYLYMGKRSFVTDWGLIYEDEIKGGEWI
jgi:hypothetical protein